MPSRPADIVRHLFVFHDDAGRGGREYGGLPEFRCIQCGLITNTPGIANAPSKGGCK